VTRRITYTVIGYKGSRRVPVVRHDELEAEYSAQLMEELGWHVPEIKMGREPSDREAAE